MSAPKRRSWLKRVAWFFGAVVLVLGILAARYAVQRREHLQLREADSVRAPVVAPKRAMPVQRPLAVGAQTSCLRGAVTDHGSGVAGMQISVSDAPPSVSGDCPCARPATACRCRDGLTLVSTLARAGLTEAVKSAVTAADGQFELCGLEGDGARLLWGEHLDGRLALPPPEQSPLVKPGRFVELEVVPQLAASGVVLTADGAVVPGASVLAFTEPLVFVRPFTTDVRGRFAGKLPINATSYVVTAPGRAPQHVEQRFMPGQVLVLSLHDEGEFAVRALFEGKPVEGASVSISTEPPLITDAHGLAHFTGLALGDRVTARVTKGELIASANFAPLTQHLLDVELKKGVHVHGVVLDEQGQPREGRAHVVSSKFVKTDAQGHFTSELLEPFVTVRPWASAEGCADSERVRLELTGADAELVLRVACAETVNGVVLDAEGKPIEGALVGLKGLDDSEHVVTEANGQFHFHQAPGMYQLSVTHDRYRSTEQPLQVPAKDVTLVLDAGGSISGRVVDGKGVGVVGAEVTVVPAVLDELMSEIEGGHMRATTDAEGRFEASGLRAGRLVLAASANSQGTTVSEVVVLQPGEHRQGLVLTLDEKVDLQGTVTDEQHQPVPQARITWDPADEKSALLGVFMDAVRGHVDQVLRYLPAESLTDADGRFVVRGLPVSKVKVSVRADGFADVERVVNKGDTVDFVLKREGGRIRGRVVDEAGHPFPRFEVDGAAFSPDDGRFEVKSRTREDSLSITAKGFTRQYLKVVMDVPEKDVGDVVMKKGFALTVHVVGVDGKPIVGAEVAVTQKVDGDRCTTREAGTCVVEPLLDLDATVVVEKHGFVPQTKPVTAGQFGVPFEVTLAVAGGRVSGVAFAMPGRPAAARTVFVAGLLTSRSALSDGAGHFTADGLVEGEVCASIDMPGGRMFEWAVVGVASATPSEMAVGPVAVGATLEVTKALPGRLMLVQGSPGAQSISTVGNGSASHHCLVLHATTLTMVVMGSVRIEGLPPGRWSAFFVPVTQADEEGDVAPVLLELLPNETKSL